MQMKVFDAFTDYSADAKLFTIFHKYGGCMHKFLRVLFCLTAFACIVSPGSLVYAQRDGGIHIPGTFVRGGLVLKRGMAHQSSNRIIFEGYLSDGTVVPGGEWNPPPGRTIEAFDAKFGDPTKVLVLLDNGSVYILHVQTLAVSLFDHAEKIGQLPSGYYSKLIGDALYSISFANVIVSRDTAKTWQIDSAGLGSNIGSILDIAMDSSQYVYVGTTFSGLYKQHPDSNIWHRVDSLYFTNSFDHTKIYPGIDRVFVDRLGRIWVDVTGGVNAPYGPYVSTDHGLSWKNDTTGIGSTTISSFGDDKFGNIYVISYSSKIYRSTNVGHSWTRIDQPLTAMNANLSLGSAPFTSIRGDSVIFVTTPFGLFKSSNQGTTWTEANQGIQAENIYSMLKLPSGRFLTSTDLGIFRRNANDTVWAKIFPVNGYFGGRPLFQDGVGNIYTLGNYLMPSYQYFVYKSTDEGTTWNPDTAGVKRSTNNGAFYVDEAGNQHTVTSSGSSSVANIAVKLLNGSWQPDTSGFSPFNNYQQHGNAFVSDGHGFLYIGGAFNRGNVWRRPIGGGSWVLDTTGLKGRTISSFTRMRNGDILAVAVGGFNSLALLRHSAGVWSEIALPFADALASSVSVDSTGAIVGAFSFFDAATYTPTSKGVYFSTDTGATWTYAGLINMSINTLVSYGDTTYALTQGNGAYLLRHQKGTSVFEKNQTPLAFSLFQNYPNPFNPSTTIVYDVPKAVHVKLTIYDILGRVVDELVNEEKTAGRHVVEWNAEAKSSGVYFYRLKAEGFVSTRKLLLIR